jgi:2,3-bisphosphoglycerate-dependent phosphoglycerate mutase
MPLELIIVRHGQSEGNRDRMFTGHGPSPLTERGRAEARATAKCLAAKPIDALYSSDLPRAVQTAEPIAELSGQTIIQDPTLREKNFGDLTGMSFAELESKHPDVWRGLLARNPNFQPPGGESHVQCRQRVGGFLTRLFETRPNGRVVLVTHGVAINHLLYSLMQSPVDTSPAVVFQIDNCSIQRAERQTDGLVRIVCINDRAHLAEVTG